MNQDMEWTGCEPGGWLTGLSIADVSTLLALVRESGERAEKIYLLWRDGMTWDKIAGRLGVKISFR